MRDNFPERIKRVLQDRTGNRCSNPECRTLTSGANAHPERATKTGVAAHITAASPGGPRYNPTLTLEQRQSAENGIWLCQTCAHFVDTDYLNYSAELLITWKCQAEQDADDETKGRKGRLPSPPIEPELTPKEGWGCPFCGTVVEFENHVCLGCQAEVVPGLTRFERQDAGKTGMMIGGGLFFALFVVLPNWLKSSYGWNTGMLWGLGTYAAIIGVLMALVGAVTVVHFSEQKRLQEPPRFFRPSIR
jgi:hypothetical protein